MRATAGLLMACALQGALAAEEEPLVQLIEEGRVHLAAEGVGGHSGECLRVLLQNTGNTTLRTRIPAGWVFVSRRPEVQDLVVMRNEVLALAPHASTTVTCRAFCCEAHNISPEAGEPFRQGHPAGAALFTLAQWVDGGRYDDALVQSAVWVLSDGNDIGSVGALDGTANDTLRLRLSRLSGQPVPRYTLRYAPDSLHACSQRPASIFRTIDMTFGSTQRLTVFVRNDQGRVMAVLFDREPIGPGTAAIPLEVDVLDWPAGRYAFQVFTDEGTLVRRLPFDL